MKDMSQRLRRRSRLLRLTLTLALVGVVSRMFYLHTVEGASLSNQATRMWTNDKTIPALRGTIFDRNNVKMAYTAKAYIVYVDPSQMKDAANIDHSKMVADLLAPILHVPVDQYSKLENMFSSGIKGWVIVAPWGSMIDQDQHDQIVALQNKVEKQYTGFVPGIYFDTASKRVYPNGVFASHVLGFVNTLGQGVTGIEEEYQKVLQGHTGSERYLGDIAGNPLPYGQMVSKPVQNGDNLQLTIDSTIQHYVEVALDDAINKYKPYRAAIIVTDPNTGAVLAMGSRPTFDPNHYGDASSSSVLYQNWAVSSTFEPGSTFKIATLTAALDQQKLNLSDKYDSGSMMVDGALVHDWNWDGVHGGWGRITYHDAFIHSSNVGFAKIALNLGAPLLYQYIDKFGFNAPTGIDLPGEATSLLFPVATIRPIELATTGYGQGISVTPIQQVAAVGAVANGGRLLRPYVVGEIIDPETGRVISTTKPKVQGIVASSDTMTKVRQMMEDEINTDREAYIPGYDVAGKTGTASIPKKGGGYYDNQNRYITSFIGFAPAKKPAVEIYVTVDTPETDLAYGSTVAGPLAKQILEQVLPYMHVPIDPSQLQSSNGNSASSASAIAGSSSNPKVQYATVPSVVGSSQSEAGNVLKTAGLSPEWVGHGDHIARQWPEAGQTVVNGSRLIAMFGDGQNASGKVVMPDLTGFPMLEATNVMTALGLSMTMTGNGYVSGQSEPAGKQLTPGDTVKLTFSAH